MSFLYNLYIRIKYYIITYIYFILYYIQYKSIILYNNILKTNK